MKQINSIILSAILLLCASCGGKQTGTTATTEPDGNAIVLRLQGSFAIGGTVITQPGTYNTQQPLKADGQTLHGDHAYVSYQIPDSARRFPMVFLHGAGQSAKTWESTPDGREGFSTIFLRRHFSTYLIDQPRRGRAGRSTVSEQVNAVADDQFWFENFRMGVWPNLYEGSQFPTEEAALDQFFRQITPNTGAYDEQVIARFACRPVRHIRRQHPHYPFARRWSRLAHGHPQPECQGNRILRTGQRICFSRRRNARTT